MRLNSVQQRAVGVLTLGPVCLRLAINASAGVLHYRMTGALGDGEGVLSLADIQQYEVAPRPGGGWRRVRGLRLRLRDGRWLVLRLSDEAEHQLRRWLILAKRGQSL